MCYSTPCSPLMTDNPEMNHHSIFILMYAIPFISAGKAVLTTETSSSQHQQKHIVPLAAGLKEFIYISIKRERAGNEKTWSNNRQVST